ncbi:MAG TPA: hypothetical protein DCR14_02840 [Acidimicrobiaceae bacterium]|nr:hypothetical protein [Acidimicrobiaceae bacterium]
MWCCPTVGSEARTCRSAGRRWPRAPQRPTAAGRARRRTRCQRPPAPLPGRRSTSVAVDASPPVCRARTPAAPRTPSR